MRKKKNLCREKILQVAELHFLVAMKIGWAAGVRGTDVPDMPNYREIVYKKDGFKVADRFCVSKEGKSAGTTTIWYFDEPIWVMNYGGFYRKEDIPFLRRALMANYEFNNFFGGRGPDIFTDQNREIAYSNYSVYASTFSSFSGKECIHDSKKTLGWHEYWGMALI